MYKRMVIRGALEVKYTDQDIYLDSFLRALKLIEENLTSYSYGYFWTKEFSDNSFITFGETDYKNATIKTSPTLGVVLHLQYLNPSVNDTTQLRLSLFL